MANETKENPATLEPLGNGTQGDPIFTTAQLEALTAAGIDSPEKVANASDEDLARVPGVGAGTIKKWREYTDARGMPRPTPHVDGTVTEKGPPISTVVDVPGVRLDDMPGRVPENVTPNPDEVRAERGGFGGVGEAPEECPTCGSRTIPYIGENPHKQGTSYCPRCNARVGPVPTGN